MPTAQSHAPASGRNSFIEKTFVCTALRGLDAEQRARALDVAAAYKRRFADREWKEAKESIRRVKEDMGGRNEEGEEWMTSRYPTALDAAPYTPLGRPFPATTASAQVVPLTTFPLRAPFSRPTPPSLTRINTTITSSPLSHLSTPRTRWDIMPCGPVTPLSPTPVGNAFAGNGFWSSLTPRLETPITAIHHEPFSPNVPSFPEAKAVYEQVKSDVDKLARGLCATRMSYRASFGEDIFFPKSVIQPRDELMAAQVAVQVKRSECKKPAEFDLMDRLAVFWEEERGVSENFAERCKAEIRGKGKEKQKEKENGLEEEPSIFSLEGTTTTTMADLRADNLTAIHQRKSSLLTLPDGATELAWTTRILEDMERLVAANPDEPNTPGDNNNNYDDDGYDYSNFMRSIRREISSTHTIDSSTTQASETNPDQPPSPSQSPDQSPRQPPTPSPPTQPQSPSILTTTSPRTRHAPSISTPTGSPLPLPHPQTPNKTPTPTPSIKESRHRAPQMLDLSTWAHQLAHLHEQSPSPSSPSSPSPSSPSPSSITTTATAMTPTPTPTP